MTYISAARARKKPNLIDYFIEKCGDFDRAAVAATLLTLRCSHKIPTIKAMIDMHSLREKKHPRFLLKYKDEYIRNLGMNRVTASIPSPVPFDLQPKDDPRLTSDGSY